MRATAADLVYAEAFALCLLSLVGLVPQNVFPRVRRALELVTAGVFATAVLATGSAFAQAPPVGATADVRDAAGRLVATAEFREGRAEVLIALSFAIPVALTGPHAVHIQEMGRCDPPDFLSAGADFNPFNKQHGRLNPNGPHVGDLPNVDLSNGLSSYNTSALGATLGAGTASLLGANRTALVLYSGEDDQLTDPDGKSGSRIACGVIVAAAPGTVAKPVVAPANVLSPVATAVPAAAALPPPAQPVPITSPIPVPAAAALPAPPAPRPPAPVQAVPGQAAGSPVPAPSAVGAVAAQSAVASPVVAAASPVVIAAAPTLAPPATATQTADRSLGSGPALIIAALGLGLIAAGYRLRRRSPADR